MIRAPGHEQGLNWVEALPTTELAINAAVHDSTGMSLAQVVFGQQLRMPVDTLDGLCRVEAA